MMECVNLERQILGYQMALALTITAGCIVVSLLLGRKQEPAMPEKEIAHKERSHSFSDLTALSSAPAQLAPQEEDEDDDNEMSTSASEGETELEDQEWWGTVLGGDSKVKPVLTSIRKRRSVFPSNYIQRTVSSKVVQSMLDASMWAPFHGSRPPWRFVVLGKKAMVDMQNLTLRYYDQNWRETGWAGGTRGTEEEYLAWRKMTEEEITGRWGPCSFMIANVMQRQAGSARMPEWEEAAATASAVQNMGIQASSFPGTACYWSSWHDAARDSSEMQAFLGVGPEDKVLGFLIVAACNPKLKDRRRRICMPYMHVDWRE